LITEELRKKLEAEGFAVLTFGTGTIVVNKAKLGLAPDEPIGMDRLEQLMAAEGFDFSGANEHEEALVAV
jgi:hypothetical protein